jgi:hypothetical protein
MLSEEMDAALLPDRFVARARALEDLVAELRHEARDSRKRAKFNAEVADRRFQENERLAKAAQDVLWFLDRHLPSGGYRTFHAQVEELRTAIHKARIGSDA